MSEHDISLSYLVASSITVIFMVALEVLGTDKSLSIIHRTVETHAKPRLTNVE